MNRYLLDTNHAGRLLRDDAQLWSRVRAAEDAEFSLCRPSIGELWFMVFNSSRVAENRTRLESLLGYFIIWELNEPAAIEFGRIRVELVRKGRPIPQIDVQIAAIARVHELTLLTSDQHFRNVQALKLDDWLNPSQNRRAHHRPGHSGFKNFATPARFAFRTPSVTVTQAASSRRCCRAW